MATRGGPHFDPLEGRWYVVARSNARIRWARVVMMDELGRDLLSSEHVHHVNGVKDDDRPENLQILSPAEHSKLHALKAEYGWKEGESCAGCGTTSAPHRALGFCDRCYHRDLRERTSRIAVCVECGQAFRSYLKARYCSHACTAQVARRVRWARDRRTRVDEDTAA